MEPNKSPVVSHLAVNAVARAVRQTRPDAAASPGLPPIDDVLRKRPLDEETVLVDDGATAPVEPGVSEALDAVEAPAAGSAGAIEGAVPAGAPVNAATLATLGAVLAAGVGLTVGGGGAHDGATALLPNQDSGTQPTTPKPAEPVDPTPPLEPAAPAEPTAPVDPTMPVDPTTPGDLGGSDVGSQRLVILEGAHSVLPNPVSSEAPLGIQLPLGEFATHWTVTGLADGATLRYRVNGGEWKTAPGNEIDATPYKIDEPLRLTLQQIGLSGEEGEATSLILASLDMSNFNSGLASFIGQHGRVLMLRDSGSEDAEIYTNDGRIVGTGNYSVYMTSPARPIPADVFEPRDSANTVDVTGREDGHYSVNGLYVNAYGVPVLSVDGQHGLRFILDTQAPDPVALKLDESQPSQVAVLGLEDHALWRYQLDDGQWLLGSDGAVDLSALSAGTHVLRVMQEDRAGNRSDIAELNFEALWQAIPAPLSLVQGDAVL